MVFSLRLAVDQTQFRYKSQLIEKTLIENRYKIWTNRKRSRVGTCF